MVLVATTVATGFWVSATVTVSTATESVRLNPTTVSTLPCCPCCELRPPWPCCPHCCSPSGLQLRQRLSFCLSDHPWSCPCCPPRHRRSLCWCRPLRCQLRWNRPCCQEGG